MKSLKTILGIALSLGGLGTTAAVVGVSSAQANRGVVDSVVEAYSGSECGTTWYIVGTINGQNWNQWNQLTLNGDRYEYTFTDEGQTEFKLKNAATWDSGIEINSGYGSDLDWSGKGWTSLTTSSGTNFKTRTGGTYTVYFDKNITSYDNGIWAFGIEKVVPTLTLSVTFASSVPSYADIYIPGSFNEWSDAKMTRSSDTLFTYSLSNVAADTYQYKIVTGYSGTSMTWDYQIDTTNKTVTISSSDSGTTKSLGSRTYDFATNLPVYSPTIQVTFASAVPDYADIYIPGSFNSWSQDIAISKMTKVSSTVFTYSLSNVIPGDYKYKVVACYSTATVVDYNHQVDGSDQTISVSSNNQISLNKSYDFASNMPQTEVAEGAVVTITFTNAIANTIDIIYVGGLTNWGTTPARISAGIMSANAQRKVFTWTIPAHTFTGNYEYKIVAMSKYTTATEVSYHHIVYGASDHNETLTIDTTTTNYSLTGLEIDLTELAAYSFSEGFNTAMAGPCSDPNANNKSAVSAIWSTWKSTFEGMPSAAKTEFGSSQGEMITQARTTYLHCVRKYNLATWTGAPSASSSAPLNIINTGSNNTAVLAILITSIVALSAAGVLFILRKKKFERT